MPSWKAGMYLAGALAALGLGHAQAAEAGQGSQTGDATTNDYSAGKAEGKDPKKHDMKKADESKKAAAKETPDSATGSAGSADDTGHLDSTKTDPTNPQSSTGTGAVDDTGNLDSQAKPAPAEEGKSDAPSTSEGTEGD